MEYHRDEESRLFRIPRHSHLDIYHSKVVGVDRLVVVVGPILCMGTGCCGNSDNITCVVDNRRGLRMFTEQIIRDPRGYYTLFIDGKFAGNYDTESEARQELYSMMNEAK